jgi:UDP-N-acetylmuramate dehydrogenase
VEFKDVCFEVQCLDWRTGELRDFSLEECQFGYRDSYFKSIEPNRWLIVAVVLRLPKQATWKIEYAGLSDVLAGQTLSTRTISDAVIAVRQSKLPDPAQIGNAGSFFKNPTISTEQYAALKQSYPTMPAWSQAHGVKLSAGWLIDQCGWKGQRDGDAGTYTKHALVLVNYGAATGTDLWQFAQRIIASVQSKFGVTLEPEPKVVGA